MEEYTGDDLGVEFHLSNLEESFVGLANDADEYRLANETVRNLVETESNLIRYLRFHEYDYNAAASSAARYWALRRCLFGDRAHNTVTDLSGNGALDASDLSFLKTGFMTILPNDKDGSPVLGIDTSREKQEHETSHLRYIRCFFYWMQTVSQIEASSDLGVVFLHMIGAGRSRRSSFSHSLAVLGEVFPVDVKGLHYCLPQSVREDTVNKILVSFEGWQKNIGKYFASYTEVHGGHSVKATLEAAGIIRGQNGLKSCGESESEIVEGSQEFYFRLAQEIHLLEGWKALRNSPLWEEAKNRMLVANPEVFDDLRKTLSVPSAFDWLSLFEEAVALIDDDDKADYIRAKEHVPYLVEVESSFNRFLGFEYYYAPAAARRMTAYWRHRRTVFGEKSFLPLIATGAGALSTDDVKTLQSERLAALPVDKYGCSVYCFNSGRSLPPGALKDSLNRILFYLFSVASENPKSQTLGISIMRILSEPSMPANSFMVTPFLDMLDEAFPVVIKSIHFIARFNASQMPDVEKDVMPVISRYIGQSRMAKIKFHLASSPQIAADELEKHDFRRETLPVELGGTWDYKEYQDWLLERSMGEANRFSGNFFARLNGLSKEPATKGPFALEKLEEAVNFLSSEEKVDYLDALRRCPSLVASESPPFRFLRHAGQNSLRAAHNLARYWRVRRELFGNSCFSLMGESGALEKIDVQYLNTNALIVLPNDEHGRSMVYLDPDRFVDVPLASQLRLFFFVWTVLLENPITCAEGFVFVILVCTQGEGFDGKLMRCLEMVKQTFPLSHAHLHFIQSGSKDQESSFLRVSLPAAIRSLGSFATERVTVHERLPSLAKDGLLPQVLPRSCGGLLDDNYWSTWRSRRKEDETIRVSVASVSDSGGTDGYDGVAVLDTSGDVSCSARDNSLSILIELMTDSEKKAILAAMQVTRELVFRETPAQRFLLFHNGDQKKAAKMLASYWTTRSALFGDRSLLPMTQTGEGALGRGELNFLGIGTLSILPKDANGRHVTCLDITKVAKASLECRQRVMFYVLDLASRNEKSQEEGFVLISLADIPNMMKEESLPSGKSILDCMPTKIKAAFVVCCSNSDAPPSLSKQDVTRHVERIFGPTDNIAVIFERSKDQAVEALERFGFSRQGLPVKVGGHWGFEHFVQWTELQTRLEWELPAGSGGKTTAERMFDFSEIQPLHTLSEEGKKERKRRMNVVHSRRKRERERIEIEVLQEQATELKERNQQVVQDNERLELLISNAKEKILSAEHVPKSSGSNRTQVAQSVPTGQNTTHIPQHPNPLANMYQTMNGGMFASQQISQMNNSVAPTVVLPFAPSLRTSGGVPNLLYGNVIHRPTNEAFSAQSPPNESAQYLVEENETLRWTIREMQRRQLREELDRRELQSRISRLQGQQIPLGSPANQYQSNGGGNNGGNNLWGQFPPGRPS